MFAPEGRTGLALLQNFVSAIRGEARLLAPAEQAKAAVELANAVLWSCLRERPIDLPLDAAGFRRLHEELKKGVRRADSG
jgi:hypothetical protein